MPLSINALFNIPTREEKFIKERDIEEDRRRRLLEAQAQDYAMDRQRQGYTFDLDKLGTGHKYDIERIQEGAKSDVGKMEKGHGFDLERLREAGQQQKNYASYLDALKREGTTKDLDAALERTSTVARQAFGIKPTEATRWASAAEVAPAIGAAAQGYRSAGTVPGAQLAGEGDIHNIALANKAKSQELENAKEAAHQYSSYLTSRRGVLPSLDEQTVAGEIAKARADRARYELASTIDNSASPYARDIGMNEAQARSTTAEAIRQDAINRKLEGEGEQITASERGLYGGRAKSKRAQADEAAARGDIEKASDEAVRRTGYRPFLIDIGGAQARDILQGVNSRGSALTRQLAEDELATDRIGTLGQPQLASDLGRLQRQPELDELSKRQAEQGVKQGDINLKALEVLQDPNLLADKMAGEIAGGYIDRERADVLRQLINQAKTTGDKMLLMRAAGIPLTRGEELSGIRSGLSGSNVIPGSPPASADEAARRLKINIR